MFGCPVLKPVRYAPVRGRHNRLIYSHSNWYFIKYEINQQNAQSWENSSISMGNSESDASSNAKTVKAVVGAAELSHKVIKGAFKGLSDVSRRVAIGVSNETDTTWSGGSVYFNSGTSDIVLPRSVAPGKAFTYAARKTAGPWFTGAVGVVAYNMSNDCTLAVMFQVPFDYNLYDNYWNVTLYHDHRKADKSVFKELYYTESPFKGNNSWQEKDLDDTYAIRGVMTNSSQGLLMIHVYQK